jgi:hypothetical protein
MTAIHDGVFPAELATYIYGVFAGTISPQAPMPQGITLQVPGN